jgi:DNA-binding transcriptional regulator YhcF (GntR family)
MTKQFRNLVCATTLMFFFLTSVSLSAQTLSAYETVPSRKASEVLPPALIRGEHFSVRDQVGWKEGLHLFTVDSDFGPFEVWGEPMLRVRLREVEALYTLKKTSNAAVGTSAAAKQMGRSLTSLGQAFRHPVQTGKALPGGVKRMFKSVKYDAQSLRSTGKTVADEKKKGGPAEGEKSAAKKASIKLGRSLAGVNSSYRKWAEQVGVNPYTTNEALHNELERIAKTEASAKVGTKIFAQSLIPEELKIITDVAKTAYHKEWREIIDENIAALNAMEVSSETMNRFLDNPNINLTIQTLFIELLEAMTGVGDRAIVIEQASRLQTDAEAAFFAESLLMAHWFHINQTPAARMLGGTLIPVILTTDGRVIAFSASDYEYWTQLTAPIAVEFDQQYRKVSRKREIWVADNVSPGFVSGVSNLGWSVRSDLRAHVLPQIPWGLQDEG